MVIRTCRDRAWLTVSMQPTEVTILLASCLREWEPLMGEPNTQLRLWREAQLKKVWGQKAEFELQFPDQPPQRPEELWLK